MKFKELDNKSEKELHEMLASLRGQLGKVRFEIFNQATKTNSQVRQLKRDIARVLTAITKYHYNNESR